LTETISFDILITSRYIGNTQTREVHAKILEVRRNRHSGQAKRDPESRPFEQFWIPAFAGMTD
jgi:hypothetical protein